MVRVALQGRRVGGWVVELAEEPETDRPLQPVAKVRGWGPPADVVDLARWAAWRWAGPTTTFLGTASPPTAVRSLPPPGAGAPTPPAEELLFRASGAVIRVPPAGDTLRLVLAAARRPDALVLTPSLDDVSRLAAQLRAKGHAVATYPADWAGAAAGGCTVIGARAAAWAPRPNLGAVLVLDEHDEGWQEERAPTWNARDVAVERARRAGVPWVLTSPCPSLEALAMGPLATLSRAEERAGWPVVEVADRRQEAPGLGLYSERLVTLVRELPRVVCVLNRKGRARLLACATCGELARCERCGAAVQELEPGVLRCHRCGAERPLVCASCGATRLKVVRAGVTRVREELERLAGRPVGEVTGDSSAVDALSAPVVVGTEAVLHRAGRADAVVFLDFDQELLAPRYRAAEEAMGLLARAARLVGGRAGGGRILVQTRMPGHETIEAAVHADPSLFAVVESARRAALRFPPEAALALVSGAGADDFVGTLRNEVDVMGPADGRWLVRAPDHQVLCDALAAAPRPAGRLRVAVDPLRA
jgi:primosomal protein N' (replication factor Y) (superfamily II helicase)